MLFSISFYQHIGIAQNRSPVYLCTQFLGEVQMGYIVKKVIKTCLLGLFVFHITNISAQEKSSANIKSNTEDDFKIEGMILDLDQVVVTATRSNKTLKNTPVITQIVTGKQIEERGVPDAKSLLMQEVAGLNFQEVGFGTSISLQGLDSKHILFLVDGERLAGETGGNIDYSRLNLNNIERIEIVKGASSAIYGSQAMGGVINIITKEAKKKVELNIGGRYAGMNQRNYEDTPKDHEQYKFRTNVDKPNLNGNASLGLNFGKFKSYTDILYQSFDGYQLYDTDSVFKYFPEYDTTTSSLNKDATSISGYEDLNISQRLSYEFNKKLKLSLKGSYYSLNKYDFTPNNRYEKSIDFSYGANINYKLDTFSELLVSYYADNYKRYQEYELLDEKDLDYQNDLIQPKIIFSTSRFKKQVITAGIEYLSESLLGDQFESGELETKSQWNSTLFLQDDWAVTDRINVVGGIRVDYHEQYRFNASPKVSFMYKLHPVTMRLNYAKGYRSPTLKELYMDWDHLGMFWIYGNSDLKPETNNYISLSGEYVSPWVYAAVTGYGNWFKNKIEGIWQNNQLEYHYTNMGNTMLAGVEATAKVKIIKDLHLNGTFNYLYTQETEGVRLSSSSPVSGNLRLEYAFRRKNYNANINLITSFMGAKDYDVLGSLTVNGEDKEAYYKAHVDAYSIWGITFTQQFYKSVRLTLGVDNIFDYKAKIINFNTSTSIGRRFYVRLNMNIDELVNLF